MNWTDYAFFTFLMLMGSMIILSCYYYQRNVWHRCPRCRRWHSDFGILPYGKLPPYNQPRGEDKICEVCK